MMAMTRTKACPACGACFSYDYTTGRERMYCSQKCTIKRQVSLRELRHAQLSKCSVEGCVLRATRTGAGMCEKHYVRIRRTGTTERSPIAGRYRTGAGYIKLLRPHHPLADAKGHVTEHRAVAFAVSGGNCPPCYWCGIKLDWKRAVVDHLNEKKDDNREDNLVVACNNCNRARGAMVPFLGGLTAHGRAKLVELIGAKTGRGE